MTPQNLRPTQCSAPEALLDQIESELSALATATLDEFEQPPLHCVDEFAPEFLILPGMPPE